MKKSKTHQTSIFLVLIIFLSHPISGQVITKTVRKAPNLKVIQLPEELSIHKVVKGPNIGSIKKSDFEGKVVIIDFWATWCAPCIKDMPKLNALIEEFKDEDVRFLSVSPESPELIERFLKRRELNSWVISDLESSLVDYFSIRKYPTYYIVDKSGQAKEIRDSEDLNSDLIRSTLTGNQKLALNALTTKGSTKTTETKQESDDPIYKVFISETDESVEKSGLNFKRMGLLYGNGYTIKEVLSMVTGKPQHLLIGDETILNKKIKIDVEMPNEKMFEEALRAALKKKFKMRWIPRVQEAPFYTLEAPNGVTKSLHYPASEEGHFSSSEGVIAAQNWKFSNLVTNVESALSVSIEDKTGLTNKFDYNLYWDHSKPESIIDALKDQLGLLLVEGTKEQEVLEIRADQSTGNNGLSIKRSGQ